MAESGQPLAGDANHSLANGSMLRGGYRPGVIGSGVVVRIEKVHLGGSIVIGILVGAVAAFLVGGMVGAHETGMSSIVMVQSEP